MLIWWRTDHDSTTASTCRWAGSRAAECHTDVTTRSFCGMATVTKPTPPAETAKAAELVRRPFRAHCRWTEQRRHKAETTRAHFDPMHQEPPLLATGDRVAQT